MGRCRCGQPASRGWRGERQHIFFYQRKAQQHKMAQSDEEDDYMNMVFDDAPKGPKFETSLQRAARKRKEVRLVALLDFATLTR